MLGEELTVDVRRLGLERGVHVAGERKVDPLQAGQEGSGLLDAGADERVRVLRPGEGRAHAGRGILQLAPERVQHRGAVPHRSRHRPDRVEARREREHPVGRHDPPGRLEADHAAARGREPDRSGAVRPERDLAQPSGERGAVAPARAAGDPAGVERVDDGAEVRVVRGDPVGELVEVRLSDDPVARLLEPGDRARRSLGDVLPEDRRAVGRHEPGRVDQVLDGERAAAGRLLRGREERPVGVRQPRRR